MHTVASRSHSAGDCAGARAEITWIEQGDGGDVIGIKRPKRGSRPGDRSGHDAGSKGVLQSQGMAHFVDHGEEEALGVAGTRTLRQIGVEMNNGLRDRKKATV